MSDVWWYINVACWGLSSPVLVLGVRAWIEDWKRGKEPIPRRIVAVVVADSIKYRLFSAYSQPQFEVHVFGEDQFERAQGLALDSIVFLGPVTRENRYKFMTRVGGQGNKVIRK